MKHDHLVTVWAKDDSEMAFQMTSREFVRFRDWFAHGKERTFSAYVKWADEAKSVVYWSVAHEYIGAYTTVLVDNE